MSKERMYVLHDVKTGTYTAPILCFTDPVATRTFGRLLTQDPLSVVALYPADYQLMCIGTFDASTGKVEALEDKQLVCSMADIAADLKREV